MADKSSLIEEILAQESLIAERLRTEKQLLRAQLDSGQENIEQQVQDALGKLKKRLEFLHAQESNRLRSQCAHRAQEYRQAMEAEKSLTTNQLEELIEERLLLALRGVRHDRQDVKS